MLEKILEEINALSEAERQQLFAIFRGIAATAHPLPTEEHFEGRLVAEGWVSLPAPPPSDGPAFRLASPFTVRGRPLSEILIAERR